MKCGKNLSSQIEKTDVVLFIAKIILILSIISLIFAMLAVTLGSFSWDGAMEKITLLETIMFYSVPVGLFIIYRVILNKCKKMCLLNIRNKQEKE